MLVRQACMQAGGQASQSLTSTHHLLGHVTTASSLNPEPETVCFAAPLCASCPLCGLLPILSPFIALHPSSAGGCLRGSPQVLLCAPTGRAAQRLEEATGMKAQTIARCSAHARGRNSWRSTPAKHWPQGLPLQALRPPIPIRPPPHLLAPLLAAMCS